MKITLIPFCLLLTAVAVFAADNGSSKKSVEEIDIRMRRDVIESESWFIPEARIQELWLPLSAVPFSSVQGDKLCLLAGQGSMKEMRSMNIPITSAFSTILELSCPVGAYSLSECLLKEGEFSTSSMVGLQCENPSSETVLSTLSITLSSSLLYDGKSQDRASMNRKLATIPSINIRLSGSGRPYEGRIEVSQVGTTTWGTVCDDGFNLNAATAFCRSMGYAGASLYNVAAYFGQGSGSIYLDDVVCPSNPSSIASCTASTFGVHNCDHSEDVGISCYGGNAGTARIAGSGVFQATLGSSLNVTSGNVRIGTLVGSPTQSACGSGWNDQASAAYCRMLGYGYPKNSYTTTTFSGSTYSGMMIANTNCQPNATTLSECQYSTTIPGTCTSTNQAGVECSVDDIVSPEGNGFRFIKNGGVNTFEGLVVKYYSDSWVPLCLGTVDLTDATAMCTVAGYAGGAVKYLAGSTYTTLPSTYSLFTTTCTPYSYVYPTCTISSPGTCSSGLVGLECDIYSSFPFERYKLSISGISSATNSYGRVLAYSHTNGTWGPICVTYPSLSTYQTYAATLICRAMGYSTATSTSISSSDSYGSTSYSPLMTNVDCSSGTAGSLFGCSYQWASTSTCSTSNQLGVSCSGSITSSSTSSRYSRIIGRNWAPGSPGRVEVLYRGSWIPVCNSAMTADVARTVCVENGYSGYSSYSALSSDLGTVKIPLGTIDGIVSTISCSSSATTMNSCTIIVRTSPDTISCSRSNQAVVYCTGATGGAPGGGPPPTTSSSSVLAGALSGSLVPLFVIAVVIFAFYQYRLRQKTEAAAKSAADGRAATDAKRSADAASAAMRADALDAALRADFPSLSSGAHANPSYGHSSFDGRIPYGVAPHTQSIIGAGYPATNPMMMAPFGGSAIPAGYPPTDYPQAMIPMGGGYPPVGGTHAGYPPTDYPQAMVPMGGGYPPVTGPHAGYPPTDYPQAMIPMGGGYPHAGYPGMPMVGGAPTMIPMTVIPSFTLGGLGTDAKPLSFATTAIPVVYMGGAGNATLSPATVVVMPLPSAPVITRV